MGLSELGFMESLWELYRAGSTIVLPNQSVDLSGSFLVQSVGHSLYRFSIHQYVRSVGGAGRRLGTTPKQPASLQGLPVA